MVDNETEPEPAVYPELRGAGSVPTRVGDGGLKVCLNETETHPDANVGVGFLFP